ncbi:putative NUDIX family NTP pyrophosphohydrolase [Aminobacter lissarensis]|uniref:NUDIX family NTP pyrophosphohydrolase n=1 Tax=Aminobacter carboxidus TaxID=376165 RepID=A0A8E1WLR3_9HYPH|nr:NUDIX domain-containing protein [Aminobacter lissarensis]MBB6469781.1 putative NUDIX family NTP pyrophosphohydrolase [Aminobacter lissarensis]
MTKKSAGILMFRRTAAELQVLLIHPGGPFWSKRDLGAWSIPKGENADVEEPDAATRREFLEETGCQPTGELIPLGTQRQPSGKMVTAVAPQGDFEPAELRSNLFEMEWPPRDKAILPRGIALSGLQCPTRSSRSSPA